MDPVVQEVLEVLVNLWGHLQVDLADLGVLLGLAILHRHEVLKTVHGS